MILQSKSTEQKASAQSQLDRVQPTTYELRNDGEQTEEESEVIQSDETLPEWLRVKPQSLRQSNKEVSLQVEGIVHCMNSLSIASNAYDSIIRNDRRDECDVIQNEEKQSFGFFTSWFNSGLVPSALEQHKEHLQRTFSPCLSRRDSHSIQASNIQSEQNLATSDSEDSLSPASDSKGETIPDSALNVSAVNIAHSSNEKQTILEAARKAGVAVAGGTMVGIGMVMIPLPTPFGFAVAGAGMAVLGTEFPAAQRALDSTRDILVDALEQHCEEASNADKSENNSMNENIGGSVKRTLKGVGQKALPLIKAMGTRTEKSA